jgi:hypothetical protein
MDRLSKTTLSIKLASRFTLEFIWNPLDRNVRQSLLKVAGRQGNHTHQLILCLNLLFQATRKWRSLSATVLQWTAAEWWVEMESKLNDRPKSQTDSHTNVCHCTNCINRLDLLRWNLEYDGMGKTRNTYKILVGKPHDYWGSNNFCRAAWSWVLIEKLVVAQLLMFQDLEQCTLHFPNA